MARTCKIGGGENYSRRFSGVLPSITLRMRRSLGGNRCCKRGASNPSRCRDAADDDDVNGGPYRGHADLYLAQLHSNAFTEINVAFPDPVCGSRLGLRHQENDHVDQNDSGACVRVRRHPGGTGLRRSEDLRVQHVSIRQRWLHRRSLLPLSYAWARPAPHRRMMAGRAPAIIPVRSALLYAIGSLSACTFARGRTAAHFAACDRNRSDAVGQSASSSSTILACCKSSVSRPSVNQP